ncbi:Tc toxin subunit A [Pseudomonas sp. RGM2987]|uniref:Tc toxin subunit A n=1 Tax=Pseudomonas sp. RGM2987 TaxID=2930090 RepID=UPI001FD67FCF|nr:Tc toxin subunit A [Pseudomonas sp. RGM2987]MCJ8206620.1 Tc toxin subunit A [Pseudomonas sp. RGM2987]
MENNSLMNALVQADDSPKKKRVDFATAMQKMGFTSVFDIVRLPKPAFARQLARHSDADAGLAYDNAMGYAALIARLYREYKTSSGTFQPLAERSGIRALVPLGPTYPNLFEENWDEFCEVGAIAAIDSPVAYLSALRVFIQQLEATSPASERILLDRRRPDLKELLITQESTFTPRPMLEIVNAVLGSHLHSYLDGLPADKTKPIQQVLAERRFPFELPYNFYHHQCQLGLSENKPRLGELNYQASLLLPIGQNATNPYGEVQTPVLQAQRLLSGLSPQQQALLVEPSVFSNFYLTRGDLTEGWKSPGSTYLCPHTPLGTCFLLPLEQADVGIVEPVANIPQASTSSGKNLAPVTFRKPAQTQVVTLALNSSAPGSGGRWFLNYVHNAGAATHVSFIKSDAPLAEPVEGETGYTATFDLITAAGPVAEPVNLAKQSFTLTLDEQYALTTVEQAFFKQSYGFAVSEDSTLSHMTDLNDFMQRTGLNAEQVEMLLCQRRYAVRLSPNCPSKNLQNAGVAIPDITGKVSPFPHASQYGACYVNGTGAAREWYAVDNPPEPESIIRDQFDNSMGLEQETLGDTKYWCLTKTSLNRLDRLQRMIRLQRWSEIPFPKLDTLILCAIRAEGDTNLGMELNENSLRALGVYRHLNQHYGIDPREFAALMHDLTPYASGKDEVPLFDQVFNRLQLFDTPLILDQTSLDLSSATPATQKTLLQLCAGLGVQPTEDGLLLIAGQTQRYLGGLKRDLPTVSSLYRQARIARLFGYSVADLLTLTGLLGGQRYKTALASGRLSPRTAAGVPDVLDVLMQLDWAVRWLKDSQQTVAQLQQRLGPNVPLAVGGDPEADQRVRAFEFAPLSDDLLQRLLKLHEDAELSVVTQEQVSALGLPTHDEQPTPIELDWFELLVNASLLDENGLLPGLDRPLSLVDDPVTWLTTDVDDLLAALTLSAAVKQTCAQKLVELLLGACNRQIQLLEGLFQETAKLPPDRCVAVIHWAHSSVYSLLVAALENGTSPEMVGHFQRLLQHAEIVVQLRLSNSALRVFLVNPAWLVGDQYPVSNSEPSLAELYLFERFSHWFQAQSQSEDSLLSYFSLANPAPPKLKNKALRQRVSETANSALARLLEWPEAEITVLTDLLTDKRARSMAQVDWVRRCLVSCQASGLSAKALLQATALNEQSSLETWKAVGDAVMAASSVSDSSGARVV